VSTFWIEDVIFSAKARTTADKPQMRHYNNSCHNFSLESYPVQHITLEVSGLAYHLIPQRNSTSFGAVD
jgi:hypothetical protein